MRVSAIPLIDVQGVNDFVYATEVKFSYGDATDVYFQIVDLEKNLQQHGYNPAGLRYIPEATATIRVTIKNIDSAKEIVRYASKPFAQDSSIWKFSIMATDGVVGTISINILLTEATRTLTASLPAFLSCKKV